MEISESLTKDIDKLTWQYVAKNMQSAYLFDSVEDFHSELVCYVLSKMDKFDSGRGKLSTFIYCCCWTRCAMEFRHFKNRGMQKPLSLNDTINLQDLGYEGIEYLDIVPDPKSSLDKDSIDSILFWNSVLPNIGGELKGLIDGRSLDELSKEFGVSRHAISKRLRVNRDKLQELRLKVDRDLPTKNIIFTRHRGRPVNKRVKKLMSKFNLSERTAYRVQNKFIKTGKCGSEEMKCVLMED